MSSDSNHQQPEVVAPGTAESVDSHTVYEVAWEVCQQVGGIYTVLRTKAPAMTRRLGDRYCVIGPYSPDKSPHEFDECPLGGIEDTIVAQLRAMGIEAYAGIWLVTGRPRAVLMNPHSVYHRLGELKYRLWADHDIATPDNDDMLHQVVAFGHLLSEFFRLYCEMGGAETPTVAHIHEWMAGVAIPEMRRQKLPVATVFTTHATMLARYLAPHDPWFYDHAPFVSWVDDARRFNIEPQVRIERAAAHGAHAFTTVSDVTAFECETLLGRKVDLETPNGLNIERYVALHEFQNMHRQYKEQIHSFVMGHFFPSYTFNLDKTLYIFTSGRYEYRNKGFDLTIEALAQLNHRLKAAGSDITVVFFLITKRPYHSVNSEALQNRAVMQEIRNTCEEIKDHIGDKLFLATARGESPDLNDMVDDFWKLRLRRMRHAWHTSRLPTIVTHDLVDDQNDEVLAQLRHCNLINLAEDPVKVVYHPDFVSHTNPFFGIDYDQFVRGCHMGIFPSAYEPWGYTPLECMARGVPAITSDLSGFGTYLMKHMPDHRENGMLVVRRRYVNYDYAVTELVDWLFDFVQLSRRDRIAMRNNVEARSTHFDWENLVHHYFTAHDIALTRLAEEA